MTDVAAFQELRNCRQILRRVGNALQAEDIFQDVWSRVIRNRSNYRPTASFATYLFHIARNCTIDHYRRQARPGADIEQGDNDLSEAQAETGDPVSGAEQHELRNALLAALQALPDEQREAFLLQQEGEYEFV